jgi:hypothetical protein
MELLNARNAPSVAIKARMVKRRAARAPLVISLETPASLNASHARLDNLPTPRWRRLASFVIMEAIKLNQDRAGAFNAKRAGTLTARARPFACNAKRAFFRI